MAKWNKVKFSLFFPAKFHLLLGKKFILNPPCVKRNLLHLFWLCLNIRREVKKTKSIPRLLKLQMVSKKRLEYTSQLNQIANVCALRLTRIDTSIQYEASAIYWEGDLQQHKLDLVEISLGLDLPIYQPFWIEQQKPRKFKINYLSQH